MFNERLKTFQNSNIIDKLNAISFIFFCMVAIDCSLTGGGHWLMVGPISFRMILGFLAATIAVPSIIRKIPQWYKDPILISLLLFVIYLAICAYIGLKKGNPRGLLLSDIKGFAWLFLVPIAVAVINNRERLTILMRCLIGTAVIQALMILAFNAAFVLDNKVYDIFYRTWMNIQLATIDQISATTYRFFFNSAPYMVVGILSMVYFQVRAKKFHTLYVVGAGLCLMALMMTFTRSIYGASFISIAVALILSFLCCAQQRKRLIGQITIAVAVVVVLTAFQYIVLGCNSAQFALARTFSIEIGEESGSREQGEAIRHEVLGAGEQDEAMIPETHGVGEQDEQVLQEMIYQQQLYIKDTQNSDITREVILRELREMARNSPVFGNGLGAAIASREDGYVEYFYQDIVNKAGYLGLLLYYFPIGYVIFSIARKWKNSDADQKLLNIIWISGITVFLVATYFNPYMNSSLGICCYSIAIACFRLGPEQANSVVTSI